MKESFTSVLTFGLIFLSLFAVSQDQRTQDQRTSTESSRSQAGMGRAATTSPAPKLCPACIRAHMEFLASDALRGRGSGTADELIAATYAASQLRGYGIAPAGDNGSYIQRAVLQQPRLTAPPQVTFTKPGAQTGGEQSTCCLLYTSPSPRD